MSLTDTLVRDSETIINDALELLRCQHLRSYEKDGEPIVRQRMTRLFELLLRAVVERNSDTVAGYARTLGRERFAAGYELFEVQRAVNVFEETLWRHLRSLSEPAEFARSIGLVSMVLGLAKDMLAQTYVALASRTRAASLDVRALG